MTTPIEYTLAIDTGPMQLSLRDLNSAVVQAERRLQDLEKTSEANAITAGRFVKGLRDVSITLASLRFVAMDIQQAFLGLPIAVAKTGAEFERMTKLMEGMSTQADATKRKLEAVSNVRFVQNMAMTTPFDVTALTDSFVKMKSVGIDPTTGALQGLVDGVAKFGGNADVLKRASVALQQMAGKGAISMEELRQQLGEAMPNAIQVMAQSLGVGVEELVDKVSKGAVSSKTALERFFVTMAAVNKGAAAEMMNTTVGLFEQLKTQWELLKNEIGNAPDIQGASFMGEVKHGMQDVIDLMKSPDMRKLGLSLGQNMAAGARLMTGAIETLIQNIDRVQLALEALAVYFGVKGVLVPSIEALKQKGAEWSAIYAENTGRIQAELTEQRLAVAANLNAQATLVQEGISRDRAAAAQRQTLRNAELAEMRAYGAEATAIEQRLAQHQDTGRVGGRFVSAANIAQMQADAAVWNQLADEKMRSVQRLNTEIANLNGTVLQSQSKLQEVAGKMRDAERATSGLSMAQKALQGTVAAGQMVWTALGGWIGVITTALMLGIAAWEKWGDSAERAAQRAMRAKMGVSSVDDLDKETQGLDGKRGAVSTQKTAIDTRQATIDRLGAMSNRTPAQNAQLEKAKAEMGQMKSYLAELESSVRTSEDRIASIRKSLTTETGRIELADISRGIQERQQMVNQANTSEINTLRARQDQELKSTKLQGDALRKLKQDQAKEANDLLVKQNQRSQNLLETQVKEQQRALDKARDSAKQADPATAVGRDMLGQVSAREQAVAALQKQLEDAQNQNSALTRNRDEAFVFGAGKDKQKKHGTGPVNSPMERALTRIRADNASLREELATLTEGVDTVESIRRRIDAMLDAKQEGGGFKYKINGEQVNGTKQQLEQLKSEMLDNELQKLGVKGLRKTSEDLRAIGEEYQRAVEVIADPSATERSTSSLGKFLTYLQKTAPEIEATKEGLRRLGNVGGTNGPAAALAYQANLDKQTMEHATIDVAGFIQKSHDERVSMEEQLFQNDRQRIEARIAKRDELYRREYQGQRDTLSRAADSMAEGNEKEALYQRLTALDQEYTAGVIARARLAARELETPLQSLARQWEDVTMQMQNSTSNWAQQGMTAFTDLATTGKIQFRDLTISILKDLARIALQKAAAGLLNMVMGGVSGGGGALFGGAQGSFDMGTPGVSATSGIDMGSVASTPIPFANGGIMTSFGQLSLQRYANGGIANRPQLALFGEGRMNEAYVPLPDGRTIPVTINGAGGQGGGQTVSIQIVVNEAQGGEQKTVEGDKNAGWQRASEQIKSIVIEELMTQSRPGGILSRH
ncbi:tape measure protein [Cupriavidus metallidurans]|uniref:tape measure protein n=1 Tax=Cupriavidus metallidurans TaxID=119219 RepID=UPI001CCF6985|nr:tape measure protein [Cupriavidus metallidurans]UBM12755.1 tape measure protein [Cupriavidus metallidurans]